MSSQRKMCSTQPDKEEAKARAWSIRLATSDDIPALEALIPLSVRTLQAAYYSPAQMDAAIGPVFGVDRQLIRDGTFFVVVSGNEIVGCGGWSRRNSQYGSDTARTKEDDLLDPAHDPARIRAFFIHPNWARRGLARAILFHCEDAIAAAGFQKIIMVATLAGEPLYSRFGYRIDEPCEIPLKGGLSLPGFRMSKVVAG